MIQVALLQSPVGPLTLAVRGGRVWALRFGDDRERVRTHARRTQLAVVDTARDEAGATGALDRYFGGDLDALEALDVDLDGTAFQRDVWTAVRRVRAGRTASYADIARAVARPAAVRAVGAANGANPVALIVPCHRIIGTSGALTGYGGGLDRKRWLLAHEGALLRGLGPALP